MRMIPIGNMDPRGQIVQGRSWARPDAERGDRTRGSRRTMVAAGPAPAASGWCPFADKHPSTNFWPGREGQRVRAVVLHIAQGTYEGALDWLCNPTSDASAHFIIARDGRIVQLVSIDDTAWANGLRYENDRWLTPTEPHVAAGPLWSGLISGVNPNLYTISIEHEGMFTDKWTSVMYAANLQLLQWIRDQTGLGLLVHDSLIGHYELNSSLRSNCPGPHVEWNRMAQDLASLPSLPRAAMIQGSNKLGVAFNDQTSLAQFALTHKLGIPLTDEFTFSYQGAQFVGQVWSLGVVYAKEGEFDRVFVSTG